MYKHILAPIDGSPTAYRAAIEAAELAKTCGATLHLLHVIDMADQTNGFETAAVYLAQTRPKAWDAAEELLSKTRTVLEIQGTHVETEVCESIGASTAETIVGRAIACGADMIVLGTHGRRGIRRILLGSDAEQVARISPVPVMLVRLKPEIADITDLATKNVHVIENASPAIA
jgi:nucleotide-binding universal stress UspA family protein